MSRVKTTLSWVALILLGLIMGVLEDLLFMQVLVPYMPASLDLTGNLFFTFTVPLAQLMALAITGSIGWFFLGLRQLPRLITFWACWSAARAAFLFQVENPAGDVLIYLLWIAAWCVLLGVLARSSTK